MSYTIRKPGSGEYIEKKSVFTGRVTRVTSETEAKAFIDEIKKQERGARHNVFAYIIGETKSVIRYSDDGEPQGTGGLPVLHVLTQNDLTDVCLVVTRFFGGILLGAPGLTRAYSKAAALAVDQTTRWKTQTGAIVSVALAYDVHARLKQFFDKSQALAVEYGQAVTVTLITTKENLAALVTELTDLSQGQVEFSEPRQVQCFVRADGYLEEISD